MTATLSSTLVSNFAHASDRPKFFGEEEAELIRSLELREQPIIGSPGQACKTNLFFGFFFDGTRNNYRLVDEQNSKAHSNVARLYDCYPGLSVPGVLPKSRDWVDKASRYTHFFRVYVPGVGTPFSQVQDSGAGRHEQLGAAAGRYGQRRIIWALVQAINNVHRYFLKEPMVKSDELDRLLSLIELNKEAKNFMSDTSNVPALGARHCDRVANEEFESILRRLHEAVKCHWPDPQTGECSKKEPGIVKSIYISVFGFSRGATEARAFANWLRSLCQMDARIRGKPQGKLTLGGFDVQFDFIGLFDTVASIGSANTFKILDGHGAWADAEDSLRIPAGVPCVHLVAAHELRRSFPVDSIAVGDSDLPFGCEEIVLPGVHSDVGGGYCPKEQGKGIDPEGNDMLSRIPLLIMYKKARLNGVPLKLELADSVAKSRFELATKAIDAFNAYIKCCSMTQGSLHQIMRDQARKQMIWRIVRTVSGKTPIQETDSFLRACTFDQNDLYSAACEFETEISAFRAWLDGKGKGFAAKNQALGFYGGHDSEWEEIATWWGRWEDPPEAMLHFFDNYVHDSRAWFKLGAADSEEQVHQELRSWLRKRKEVEAREEMRRKWAGRGVPPQLSDGLETV